MLAAVIASLNGYDLVDVLFALAVGLVVGAVVVWLARRAIAKIAADLRRRHDQEARL
jgi:divalent metal cation (Fe/Co/Zn/Cd) transporter